ncbi:MAG: RNA-dependent RNA polymerase [Hangzhou astrovirus 1]|nr:MAG: RNA-dependent RNA polymerase [Hangzhou astrovirus 1]
MKVGNLSPEPYYLRGEERGEDRSLKWDVGAAEAVLNEEESAVLSEYFFERFAKSGVEFCDREVTPHHYPGDASPGLPFMVTGYASKASVAGAYTMRELCDSGWEQILRGDIPIYEFAKTEPIKREKDVRTIMCYPFHVHCALLEKLLAFSEVVKTLPQCKIGWSKWRLGVQDLCNSLDRTYCFEADAKRFDAALPNCIVRLILDVYFSLWPPGTIEPNEVDALCDSIVSGFVFSSNGQVYYKTGGNPSGNPVTTELNTAVHLALWVLAYYRKHSTLDGFDDMVLYLYGDDVIGSNNGELLPAELQTLLHDMPVKYPPESCKVSNNPEGLTFLGCVFYRLPGFTFWLWKPGKPNKMLATLMYTEKRDREIPPGDELARVRGILLECAWDKQMWNLLYPYQLVLEEQGAEEGVVGRHVDRRFVDFLTFGLQGGTMPKSNAKKGSSPQKKKVSAAPQAAQPKKQKKVAATMMVGANGAGRRRKTAGAKGVQLPKGLSTSKLPITTTEGMKYAMAALHPCNEAFGDAVAYPDDIGVPTHSSRMQLIRTFAAPDATCNSTSTANVDKCGYNLMIVASPWPEIAYFVCFTQGNDEPPKLSEVLRKRRETGDSKYNINDFALVGDPNVGLAYDRWYYVSWPNFTTPPKNGLPDDPGSKSLFRELYTRGRVVAKGVTSYMNASRMNDGGRVTTGQFPCSARFVDSFDTQTFGLDVSSLKSIFKKVGISSSAEKEIADLRAAVLNLNSRLDQSVTTLNSRVEYTTGVAERASSSVSEVDKTVISLRKEFDNHEHVLPIVKVEKNKEGVVTDVSTKTLLPGLFAPPHVVERQWNDGYRTLAHGDQFKKRADELDSDFLRAELSKDQKMIHLVANPDKAASPEWLVNDPPSTEDAIFYGDSKATTWEARHGAYQVMRIERPQMDDVQYGSLSFMPLNDKDTRTVAPGESYASPWVSISGTGVWGVTYYRGISKASSLTVKCVQYTQGVVNPAGPYANLSPTSVDPDLSAVDFVAEEQRRLAHAYPSKFNDLGEILGRIFGVAKQIGKTVKTVAGAVEGIPVIGDVAGAVNGILSSLGL